MRRTLKLLAANAMLFAVASWIALPAAFAAGARLEGRVLGMGSRAAEGHRIHLIGNGGEDVAQSTVGDDGLYTFTGLDAGQYSLGIELRDGTIAPVAAPPVRLGNDELARRDLKLLSSDVDTTSAALRANYGLGQWWKALPGSGKAWTILGVIVGGALVYDALDDEDPASPTVN